VPLDVDFESLRYRGASRERCYELFSRLAFRAGHEYAPTADTIEKDYALVTPIDELDALVGELRAAGEFALRCFPRAVGDAAGSSGIAFRPDARPLRAAGPRRATSRRFLPARADRATAITRALERCSRSRGRAVRKSRHDLKFDAIVLAQHGVTLRGLRFDSMLASYLLDATRPASARGRRSSISATRR
jgi:DNA polymerase-1